MKTVPTYQFCFDLCYNEKLNAYLPVSYILNHSKTIDYIDKRATIEIVKSFGIDYETLDLNTKKLLIICENLKPEMIFKKFSKNTKSIKKIEDLLKDNKIAFGMIQYINTNLNEFINLIIITKQGLSLNISKNKDFFNHKIEIKEAILKPKLKFDKNEDGIKYSLVLQENEIIYEPSKHKIDLILDDPCWIILDKKLYLIEGINAKKLTPFLKKTSIDIPTKLIPDYFEKFIKDVVKKVVIESSGFDIILKNEIKRCLISINHDFFKNCYNLNLHFDYDGYIFDDSKAKKTHSEIDLSNLDNIKVIQYKRNEEENLFASRLCEIGFEKTENDNYKQLNNSKFDTYQTVQWLINNKDLIIGLGFSLENLKLEGKVLFLESAIIQQTSDLKNDWFDIKMTVVCGDYQFNFVDIIQNIKNQNRVYHLPNNSVFLIPITWFTTYSVLIKQSKNENGVLRLPKNNFAVLENNGANIVSDLKIEYFPSSMLKTTLRPYQIEGVKWLLDHYNNGLGACLADDMGLGKTLQTLAVLVAVQEQLKNQAVDNDQTDMFVNENVTRKEYLKTLIVMPSSLIFNWNNEARKFAPHLRKIQYVGNERKLIAKKLDRYDLIFTSYSILARDILMFEKYNFRYLILDESQYIKNKNSKVFKSISKIQAENKISLSGTPIENSLDDLWSQMQFINPNILGDFNFFNENYKIPIQKKQDETVLSELKSIINPFILRRTKEQVLKDLPELIEQVFYCDMEPEQEKLYDQEKSKARNYLLNNDNNAVSKINIINSLMQLRKLSNHPKMIDKKSELDSGKYIAVTNYLQSLVQSNQKTIIFSSFLSNLDFYKKWSKENEIDYCELIGENSQDEREAAVNRFQNESNPLLFFISLKAGGVGLNITKASFVLFLDPWWNPFAEKQGIGRAHRIGQENKVTVVRFISKNTIEEKILLLQANKKLLSDSLLDENFISTDIEVNLDYILS